MFNFLKEPVSYISLNMYRTYFKHVISLYVLTLRIYIHTLGLGYHVRLHTV